MFYEDIQKGYSSEISNKIDTMQGDCWILMVNDEKGTHRIEKGWFSKSETTNKDDFPMHFYVESESYDIKVDPTLCIYIECIYMPFDSVEDQDIVNGDEEDYASNDYYIFYSKDELLNYYKYRILNNK